jgi:DNA-binding CsgD family transcriptional regulator
MSDLVGRDVEQCAIDDLVGRLPEAGGSLVLHGEAGIGKTSLGLHALALAARHGVATTWVTATESETGVAFAALHQILQPHTDLLRLMRAYPRSVLERAWGVAAGEPPDVFAVAMATLELLSDAGAEHGLLVVVDDAQWIDGSTARVLSFVGRRTAREPIAVVMALRDGHPSPILEAGLETIEVGPLTGGESRQLLDKRRRDLAAPEAAHVLRLAQGNPLALLELPTDTSESASAPTAIDQLHRAFLARLSDTSAQARTVLLLAALDDGDELTELQAAAAGLDVASQTLEEAVSAAGSARALLVEGERFRFSHPLVRSALVSAASPAECRAAHAALAEAVGPTTDRGVWHRAAAVAGPDDAVAGELEAAALRARSRGSLSVAHRAWARAAELSSQPADSARRRLRGAEAAMELGRPDVAATVVGSVSAETLTTADATRLALLRLSLQPQAQRPAALDALTRLGRAVLDAGDVELAIEVSLAISENVDAAGRSSAASELARVVAARLPHDDPRRIAVLAAGDPGPHLGHVARAISTIDPARMTYGAELLIRVRSNIDADPALAQLQRGLLQLYRERGQLRSIAFLQPIHTWNEIVLGSWPEALRSAEEGSRLAVEIGFPRWGTGTLVGEAFVAAIRGDEARAEPLIEESERGALLAGANHVLTGIQLTKGVNHLAQGRYGDAFAAFRRAFDPAEPSHHPVQSGWMLGDLAEAAAHAGRLDEVRHLYDRDPEAPTSPWQAMAETYAAPFLATTDQGAEAAYLSALSGVVGTWPTYRTRLVLEYGSWLRRRRRLVEAREQLTTARELADAYSMGPWSERARAELRVTGADSAPRRARAWEALSAQELQVAELAGQGLSNREIGERLFLSHRTVASHLYRVFPKLGIAHRSQLAAALRSE